jgi:chromosomal replication initiation ATPase DnaA
VGPREGSKTARVVAMLKRKNGATLAEIMTQMGWQKHTVRGFMARAMKKAGYTIESFKSEEGECSYRINPYIERNEPVVLIGECGTGKSHLATGLCVAACRQKRRVRFTTAAALVNELVEAEQNNRVRRMMKRWQSANSSPSTRWDMFRWRMWVRSFCFRWHRSAPSGRH